MASLSRMWNCSPTVQQQAVRGQTPFSGDQMWHLFSPGRETEDEDTQVTAQASVEEPGPNAQALNELPEVQPGEQVCPDLLKAEDFLDCH